MERLRPESAIDTIGALEAVVGKIPFPVTLKVIDHLDQGALRWIAESPLMFAGFGDGATISITLGGGNPGFATAEAHEIRVPTALLDDPTLVRREAAFGSLFLLPGIGETLRVNGRVTEVRDSEIRIRVEECYGHCAKALIRSDFWGAAPDDNAPRDAAGFISVSRFMALATIDANGHADLSPKGDPVGKMALAEAGRVWFADRPGNKRVDSFRNIIANRHAAAVFLIPGSTHVVRVAGTAAITTAQTARARFVVQDKIPALAVALDTDRLELAPSPALGRARMWPVSEPAHGIQPAKLFLDHTKLNKNKSFGARLAGAALSLPGSQELLKKGLEKDYKDNLY